MTTENDIPLLEDLEEARDWARIFRHEKLVLDARLRLKDREIARLRAEVGRLTSAQWSASRRWRDEIDIHNADADACNAKQATWEDERKKLHERFARALGTLECWAQLPHGHQHLLDCTACLGHYHAARDATVAVLAAERGTEHRRAGPLADVSFKPAGPGPHKVEIRTPMPGFAPMPAAPATTFSANTVPPSGRGFDTSSDLCPACQQLRPGEQDWRGGVCDDCFKNDREPKP